MKKIIFLVIDGLGEEPVDAFGKKTPLEEAKTPNFNFLAKNGILGCLIPWREKNSLPTSEDCHLALFGFDPKKFNPGRGVLEALGAKMKIKKGDLCFRANFATLDQKGIIIDRRAGRIEKTEGLISALRKIKIKGVKIFLKKAFGHRFVLVLRGKNLSAKVSSNDPKKIGVFPLKILGQKRTVKILNNFLEKAKAILENHPINKERIKKGELPANYILLRGAGKLKKIQSFKLKYGKKACVIAGGTLYKGIGQYLGMKEIKVKGANGMFNTNLKGKFLAAKKALSKFDFIFLHIKAADNLAEDGNFLGKKEFLEKIDKEIKNLFPLENTILVITGDHNTSCQLKSHSPGLVPFLIFDSERKFEGKEKFSEKNCQKGQWDKILQIKILSKVLKLAKK